MPNPIYKFINVHYFNSLSKLLKKELGINTDRNTLEKLYKTNNSKSLPAINDRKVGGHILVETKYDIRNDRFYYILSNLIIKKEYRKLGISTTLIKKLEKYARKNKIYYLEYNLLNPNKATISFLHFNHFKKARNNTFYKNLIK